MRLEAVVGIAAFAICANAAHADIATPQDLELVLTNQQLVSIDPPVFQEIDLFYLNFQGGVLTAGQVLDPAVSFDLPAFGDGVETPTANLTEGSIGDGSFQVRVPLGKEAQETVEGCFVNAVTFSFRYLGRYAALTRVTSPCGFPDTDGDGFEDWMTANWVIKQAPVLQPFFAFKDVPLTSQLSTLPLTYSLQALETRNLSAGRDRAGMLESGQLVQFAGEPDNPIVGLGAIRFALTEPGSPAPTFILTTAVGPSVAVNPADRAFSSVVGIPEDFNRAASAQGPNSIGAGSVDTFTVSQFFPGGFRSGCEGRHQWQIALDLDVTTAKVLSETDACGLTTDYTGESDPPSFGVKVLTPYAPCATPQSGMPIRMGPDLDMALCKISYEPLFDVSFPYAAELKFLGRDDLGMVWQLENLAPVGFDFKQLLGLPGECPVHVSSGAQVRIGADLGITLCHVRYEFAPSSFQEYRLDFEFRGRDPITGGLSWRLIGVTDPVPVVPSEASD
jgi:hypothetical protein